MTRTLKDLALALINATLILLAVCLFLGLRVADRANDVAHTFATALADLGPVRQSLDATTAEVAALRADLEELRANPGAQVQDKISVKAEAIEARLDTVQDSLAQMQALPYDLTDHAIEKVGDELAELLKPLAARAK